MREDREIEEESTSFFSKLYGPGWVPRPFLDGLVWCPILVREKHKLEASFALEEIRKVSLALIGISLLDRMSSLCHSIRIIGIVSTRNW